MAKVFYCTCGNEVSKKGAPCAECIEHKKWLLSQQDLEVEA